MPRQPTANDCGLVLSPTGFAHSRTCLEWGVQLQTDGVTERQGLWERRLLAQGAEAPLQEADTHLGALGSSYKTQILTRNVLLQVAT